MICGMSNCLIRWRWVRSHRRGLPFAREGVDGRVTGFIHVGSFRPNWFDGSPFLLHPSKVARARVIALKNPEPRLTNPGVKLQWIVKTKVFLLAESTIEVKGNKAFSSFLSTDQARRAQQKERNSLCGAFTGLASQEKKKSKSTSLPSLRHLDLRHRIPLPQQEHFFYERPYHVRLVPAPGKRSRVCNEVTSP
jgi:hypothetical protein